jgi:hypothetical protein
MSNRIQTIVIAVCVVLAAGFVSFQILRKPAATGGNNLSASSLKPPFTERTRLAEFTRNGVAVTVFLETDSSQQPVLRATFKPQSGFHLYSKDHDPKTTRGIGVPTRADFAGGTAVSPMGLPITDVAAKRYDFDQPRISFDIYPDGPVTWRQAIRIESSTNATAQLAISYMACKTDGVCLRPVDKYLVDIAFPQAK